jgi:hypothetical protein
MLTEEHEKKFILICKPEQSGKTFIMIQQIIKDIHYPPESNVNVVNIIFCDNNLLLTKQTSNRINHAITPISINEQSYLEFSSHSRTSYRSSDNVCNGIIFQRIHNVLCCTNGHRARDIEQIINTINNSEFTKGKFIFKIWLDEADKYVKFIQEFLKLIKEFENVYLYCITATPKKIFCKFNSINVFPIENTTSEEYHGWLDNKIITIDLNIPSNDFIIHILDSPTLGGDKIISGNIWFIPGEFKKASHYEICDICNERGFAVIIINGDGITLKFPDKRIEKYNKDDELNIILKKIYKDQSLEKYPLVITGNVCIGRGISIMSKDFIIDYAILSICDNQQEASQNAGRLKGNMKNWTTYKPPTVFTTLKFNDVAIEWEIKSKNIARIAFENEEEGKSTIITNCEFQNIGKESQTKPVSLSKKPNLRVPIIINADKTDDIFIKQLSKESKIEYIKTLLTKEENTFKKLLNFINTKDVVCQQISTPQQIDNGSYKRHITDIVNNAEKNKPYIVDNKLKTNNWTCFIDKFNGRLAICVYSTDEELY